MINGASLWEIKDPFNGCKRKQFNKSTWKYPLDTKEPIAKPEVNTFFLYTFLIHRKQLRDHKSWLLYTKIYIIRIVRVWLCAMLIIHKSFRGNKFIYIYKNKRAPTIIGECWNKNDNIYMPWNHYLSTSLFIAICILFK